MSGEAEGRPIRVLVVDDSALVRRILTDGLDADPGIQVVGTAQNPYQARDLLVRARPDVITLDVEMPRMDGVTFLRRFMRVIPTPTIVLSALTREGKQLSIDALMAGAVEVMAKPAGIVDGLPGMMAELTAAVRRAARVDRRNLQRSAHRDVEPVSVAGALEESTDKVVALGASTGGVEALARILPSFPPFSPGIVIAEHLPAGFSAPFAERLNRLARVEVKEAVDGDRVRPGLALVAPAGERNLEVVRSGGQYRVRLVPASAQDRHVPSVDVLFSSVARYVGRNAVAALLTGMGSDGAEGLHQVRSAGGRTFVQDEATSVVFGMPRAAWMRGAAEALVPLDRIPDTLMRAVGQDYTRTEGRAS